MSNAQLDHTCGFNNSHFTSNIFAHTFGDYRMYPSVDPMKPLEFDDPHFECLGTHQEVKAFRLLLMVMSGSHIPDETPEPSRIRVSEIRISAHHAPLNIILSSAISSWKSSNSGDVALSKPFHHLAADMHQPL